MISIIIVDDHKLIREGLKQLIEFNEDMTVIAEYSNGIDYLKEIDNKMFFLVCDSYEVSEKGDFS